jgi:thiol-disulfide isomerase/thioredoxin
MQKIASVLFVLIFIFGCKQQDSTVLNTTEAQLGFKVPNMDFKTILNSAETSSKLYEYTEELIILDFWATWCGPCLGSFPKMTALQKEFAGRIKIIAVTDEKEERINTFLTNRPQGFSVALDSDGTLNGYFKHRTIPHYVILDTDKVVRAIVHSDFITSENINKLLQGDPVAFTEKKENIDFDESLPFNLSQQKPIYQSALLPFNPDAGAMSNNGGRGGNRMFALNLTYPSMLRMAFEYPYDRTKEQFKDPKKYRFAPENQFCYEMIFPDHLRENRFELMKEEILAISGISAELETVLTDVYLLQKIPGTSIEIPISTQEPDPNAFIRYGEGITIQGQPMTDLANYYEAVMQLPVINATGYDNIYDIAVKWYEENPKQGLAELTKYGLQLKKAQRPITFLVLSD